MAWLSGYSKRIKLTIDYNKIDSNLSNFPVTVFFTSSQGEEIFDEFDADSDYMKCAFTSDNGTTQLYAEKELFDVSEEKAIYHVKVPSISSSANTIIYYYFDNSHSDNTDYIGAIDTTAGANVWDSNFKAVYHMADADNARIDVGSAATDRANASFSGYTFVDKNNSANATGKISRVEIWAYENMTGCIVATFSADGNDLTARDSYEIGAVAAGSKQTFSVNLDIESGDYLGIYFESGAIERDSYGEGYWLLSGDYTDCTDTTFGFTADRTISVYGLSFDITDSTSNTNHGTKKDVGEPAEATGKVGQGQDFDGSDDYITIGTSTIGLTDNITVEAVGNIDTDINGRLIAKHKTGNYGWLLARSSTDNTIEWRISTNGSDWNGGFTNTNTFNIATDYYFAGIYNGSQMKVFIDGAEETAGDFPVNLSGNINDSSQDLQIGSDEHSGTNFFDGIIDETRISSTARSAAWIKATYNSLWDTLLTYGSAEMSKNINETLHTVDTLAKSGIENISETLHIVDSILKSGTKALAESFNIFDSFFCLIHLTETLHLADSLAKSGAKQLDEVIGVIDSILKSGIRYLSESMHAIDSYLIKFIFNELVNVIDSILCKIFVDEVIAIIDEVGVTAIKLMYETLHIVDWFWGKLRRKISDWLKQDKNVSNWTKIEKNDTNWRKE